MGVADNKKQTSFSAKEKTQRMWPPWPWPPWDGDDDGGGDDDDKDKPHKHRDIRKLAEKVVDFEGKMAKASLDL